MDFMNILRASISICLIFWISNCGGEAGVSTVSISPSEPFILSVDRKIPITAIEFLVVKKPSITFQLRMDNKGNGAPLTIVGLTLDVNGPKGRKIVPIDPSSNIFSYNPLTADLAQIVRPFFAEVKPYQASFCMDKISYLKEENISRSCTEIGNDTSKIVDFGVSAVDTIESADNRSCCPTGLADLTNIVIIAGGLQEYSSEEVIPSNQNYSINASVVGLFGTFLSPVANYSTQVFFNARSF